MPYIYDHPNWPHFIWDNNQLLGGLSRVRYKQGRLLGKMQAIGFDLQNAGLLESLALEVTSTAAIEDQSLDLNQVRSSVARRLNINFPGSTEIGSLAEGAVEFHNDIINNYGTAISERRMFRWHRSLFPVPPAGLYRIAIGRWRDDRDGPLQVVSGAIGKEIVHFQAPPAQRLPVEMRHFFKWFNANDDTDPVIKSAVAHLWFVTIHPFEDGNGRIARALGEMQLARAEDTSQRFYSLSSQINTVRDEYYAILEKTQNGKPDLTEWLVWYIGCLSAAIESAEITLSDVVKRHKFWTRFAPEVNNPRQKLVLDRLLEGIEGRMTTSKWAKMAKCSTDTALRDIRELLQKNILIKTAGGGRSTGYQLKPDLSD